VIRSIQPFELNGWLIRPCDAVPDGGFDVVHGNELYHYEELEPAVVAAQRSRRGDDDE
jgi:hypothetical protein